MLNRHVKRLYLQTCLVTPGSPFCFYAYLHGLMHHNKAITACSKSVHVKSAAGI